MKSIGILFLLFISLTCLDCSKQHDGNLIYQNLHPCQVNSFDSTIRCGTFPVFENRQTGSGKKIDLYVVVIPAIHRSQFKPPIFCLDGGPGIAQTKATSFYLDSINYYRLDHDIVLIDVRGTGHSNPLHCKQLQLKMDLKQQFTEMYPVDAVKNCYDSLSKIADLTQYTTTNMAIDMEEIRKWLGYDKINLLGLSFGGRLAQVYMKMFPNSVASCVLWSSTTTSSKLPLYNALYAEESINKIFNDCKNDTLCNLTFPNFKEEFNDLMRRGKNEPFEYKFKNAIGETQNIIIPWYSFQTKIRSLMYSPLGIRQIPFIVHQSYTGNWQAFISLFPDKSSYDDLIAEGLYLCVTCAEDVPYISRMEEDSLTRGTFLGDYRIEQQRNACSMWVRGTVPDNFFEPVSSTIPTALFSGYFDPVTATSMAKQIVQTLPNSFLITIPTMSHTLDGLSNAGCFDRMVVDFFNNPEVRPNDDCIKDMLPMAYKTTEKQ